MCKNKKCLGNSVEIDELFLPVITELNSKGYKTKFCCSGHLCENPNSYIYFEDYAKLPCLPDGYMFDQDMYPQVDWNKWQVKNTIRKQFNENKDIFELSKDIFKNAISVLEWAEGLDVLGHE